MTSPTHPPVIGVLGGGQLGRMLALEARRMGYRIVSWTGTAETGPAALADVALAEPFDSPTALNTFVSQVTVATVEFENIPVTLLESLEEKLRLAPGSAAVAICQHREREKAFLSKNGFPCPHHAVVDSAEALAEALAACPSQNAILKTAEFGYDGKGQQPVARGADAPAVWKAFGGARAVLEERVDLAGELSVLLARDASGDIISYAPAENFHRDHILDLSVVPARFPDKVLDSAREIALGIAETLSYQGLLAVEFFLAKDGRLLVNELAPRPHNSGHHTLDACQTSQFEQQLRVACHLPLGGTATLTPCVMWNLLGDLWSGPGDREPDWSPILRTPGAKLHLYGKGKARNGRKMGHVTFLAETRRQALEHALRCRKTFGIDDSPSTFDAADF